MLKLDKEHLLKIWSIIKKYSKLIYTPIHLFIKKWSTIETWKDYFIPENPEEHPRLVRFLGLTFVLVSITIALVFLISFTILRMSIPTVRVPSVVSMDITDAIAVLQSNSLRTRFEITYNDQEPKYQVIKQYPAQGSSVREGREVNLIISLGADKFTVPKLCNMSKEEAIKILDEKKISYEFLVVPANQHNGELDKIIALNMPVGKEVPRKNTLILTITDDILENQYRMDNFIRQPLEFAANTLYNNHIKPIIITTNIGSLADDGLVLEQNISEGSILMKNSSAILTVGLYAYNQGEQDKMKWHIFNFTIPKIQGYQEQIIITNEDGTFEDISLGEQHTAKHYKVILEDEIGRHRTIYERVGAEGSSFIRVFKSFGKTKVYVYANDEIIGSKEYGSL